jgi:hypothetical protein
MGWGWLEDIVDTVHDATTWIDPIGHYSLDAAHDTSTDLVNETSRLIERIGGDSWLGQAGEHWKNMSQKDKDDFARWATNTGLSAAAVYGGMSAAGGGGGAAGAAGEGAAGADGAWLGAYGDASAGGGLYGEAGSGLVDLGGYGNAASGVGAGQGGAGVGGYLEAGGGMVGNGSGAAAAGQGGYTSSATQALNALLSAYQSKKAADALQAGGDAANVTQRYMFDTINAQGAPYRTTAYGALDNINALMRDPSQVVNDPGYKFGLSQGQRGLDNSASARGGIGGAALKAASRYNTDYATTKLNDVYNRNFTAAGLANNSNSLTGSAGMNMANQVGATQRYMGEAQAGNALNQGNIWGTALNGLAAYGQNNGWWGG